MNGGYDMTWLGKLFPTINGSVDAWGQILNDNADEAVNIDVRQQATFHISGVEATTYTIEMNSRYGYDIEDVTYKTTGGTLTLAVQINGSNVGALGALAVTSTEQTTAATTSKAVAIGDDVSLVVSSISSASTLIVNVWYNRTSVGTA